MKAEAIAKLRYLRVAPRKVRLLVSLIRGLRAEEAVTQLENSSKSAAKPVLKLLQSAIANAVHNHEMSEESLIVKKAFVDGGPMLKRWMPRAMGRAASIHKHTSHITLVLEGEVKETKKAKKQADKKEKETETVEKTAGKTAEPKKEVKTEKKAVAKKTTKTTSKVQDKENKK